MSAQSADPGDLLGIDMSTPSVDFGTAGPSGILPGEWEAADYGDASIDPADSVEIDPADPVDFAGDVSELFGEPEVWDAVEDYGGLAETDDTVVTYGGLDPDIIDDILDIF
jgi:hypothetical protein